MWAFNIHTTSYLIAVKKLKNKQEKFFKFFLHKSKLAVSLHSLLRKQKFLLSSVG